MKKHTKRGKRPGIALPKVSLTKKTRAFGAVMIVAVVLVGAFIYHHRTADAAAVFSLTANKPEFVYKCNGDPESILCLEQTYSQYTQKHGVPAAFVKLKAAYITDPSVHAYCHILAHAIGRTAAQNAKSVDDAYAQGDNFCWSGYYHGVMEAIVTKIGEQALPSKIPTICAQIKKEKPYSFEDYNCVHGLGHGILDVYQGNIFTALHMCDLLTDNWDQQSCYSGVFMENIMDETSHDRPVDYLKAGQPMYPCTAVQTKYKEQCYLMQTSHALLAANDDFSTVFTECSQVDTAYVDTCYQSLGRDASGNSESVVDPTKAKCMLGPTQDAQANCIIGAVKDFISYYHSDSQANNLCLSLDTSLQSICQTTKTQYWSTF